MKRELKIDLSIYIPLEEGDEVNAALEKFDRDLDINYTYQVYSKEVRDTE